MTLEILTFIFLQVANIDWINGVKEIGLFPLFALGCLFLIYRQSEANKKTIKEKDTYIKQLHASNKDFAQSILERQDAIIDIVEQHSEKEIKLLHEIKGIFQNTIKEKSLI